MSDRPARTPGVVLAVVSHDRLTVFVLFFVLFCFVLFFFM